MSEQERKQQGIYDLLDYKIKPKFLCLPYTKQRMNFAGKELFKEKGEWRTEQKNEKKAF